MMNTLRPRSGRSAACRAGRGALCLMGLLLLPGASDRLAADVNGSAVYLFALLKMKLKMAARRRTARLAGAIPRVSGALDRDEQCVFDELEKRLFDALGFEGELRCAAAATSARRDAADAARRVSHEFARRGRAVLAR